MNILIQYFNKNLLKGYIVNVDGFCSIWLMIIFPNKDHSRTVAHL